MENKVDVYEIIEMHLDDMTELERHIAHYFLTPEGVQNDLSSQQVALTLHISPSALTRFAKKCGFTGYREFIFQYIHQNQKTESNKKLSDLSRRVFHNYSKLQENTKKLLNEEQLLRIASMMEGADRVYFFGTGSSGLVAREMKLRFMRLGVVCEALTDPDGFAWTTSIMDKNCLVIAFSLSGKTLSILDSLTDAKQMGAQTVLFTSQFPKEKIPFHETVFVSPHGQPDYIQRISAQFPMLLMIDFLYAYFLEIDRERKEKIFNSYWENKKLNGYHRKTR
ncbi:Sialic acid utilization regulator, RpiR family [Streptococcus sp. DD10]|uniref:MurR/RpiR family transcriptional regulator n=1 Tax=Streptococcus sp. DD10 TaxID=1777878 RepID=UPI000798FC9D|nr:MurR/RpiR family transcriptional regulator [Streptococcus sp. DD10]KXT73028.1 Sialic acid utilization regulator, RpiR family [Streptococcus sp. DD10]